MPQIQTERLTLIPLTIEAIEAALRDRAELERVLGVSVPGEWPGPDFGEVLPGIADMMRSTPGASPSAWTWLITHTADRTLIGDAGFIEPPKDGAVEIGYSIVPSYWLHGYATETARALLSYACAQPGVERIEASCLDDNVASIRVLEKIGMARVGIEENLIHWEISCENLAKE